MSAKKNSLGMVLIATAVFCMTGLAASQVYAQASPESKISQDVKAADPIPAHHVGLVQDWSSRHLIFSNPGRFDQVQGDPAAYARWLKVQYDPRYIMQKVRRSSRGGSSAVASHSNIFKSSISAGSISDAKTTPSKTTKKDWSESMLEGAVLPNAAPGVYNYNADGTPDCTHDFVSFPTGAAGAASAKASLTEPLTPTSSTAAGQTITITNGSNTMTLYATPTSSTVTGTFTGAGGYAEGSAATITTNSGADTYTLVLAGEGTVTFGSEPADGDTITIGATTYTFDSGGNCTNFFSHPNNCVLVGNSTTNTAKNLAAALADRAGSCGNTYSFTGACFWNVSGANADVTPTTPTSDVLTLTNSGSASVTFSSSTLSGDLFPTTGIITEHVTTGGVCEGTSPTFTLGVASATSSANQALYFYDAIHACGTITGVTASQSGSTVTLTAGTGTGTAATLAETLSDFSWSATTLPYGLAASNTYPYFETSDTNALTEATQIASEITANGTTVGVSASASGNATSASVVITATTAGSAGNTISVDSTVNDFTFDADLAGGSTGAAVILAYNNLYSGTCTTGTVPAVNWAYNTGTGYAMTTSPEVGFAGQIAFIQSNGTNSELVVLKPSPSVSETASSPGVPTTNANNSGSNLQNCTVPCMTVISLGTSILDSYSEPYYDYIGDALYVGDNASHLYKFTGVFNGTTISGPTSVTLNATAEHVSSPVYDSVSGCVFVADTAGNIYSVNSGVPGTVCASSTFGTVVAAANLGGSTTSNTDGAYDGPIVDSSAQRVYFFIDDVAAQTSGCTVHHDDCVAQYTTTITSGQAPTESVGIGGGQDSYAIYAGSFDNVYYSSATPTGSLYVVGNTNDAGGGFTKGAILYRVPINNNVLSTSSAVTTTLSGTDIAWPSPITELCNPGAASECLLNEAGTATTTGTDHIYFSVYYGDVGTCSKATGTACVLDYNVSTPLSGTANTPVGELAITAAGTNGCFSTGAIVVDNVSTSVGASQVYFVNMNGNSTAAPPTVCTTVTGNTINAVQAGQNSLN